MAALGVSLALILVMLDTLPSSATQVLRRWTSGLPRLEWAIVPTATVAGTARSASTSQAEWELIQELGCVAYEESCVVGDDPGEIVRHAAPLDGRAQAQLREQQIARMQRDPEAVAARERRIAIERAPTGRVLRAMFG